MYIMFKSFCFAKVLIIGLQNPLSPSGRRFRLFWSKLPTWSLLRTWPPFLISCEHKSSWEKFLEHHPLCICGTSKLVQMKALCGAHGRWVENYAVKMHHLWVTTSSQTRPPTSSPMGAPKTLTRTTNNKNEESQQPRSYRCLLFGSISLQKGKPTVSNATPTQGFHSLHSMPSLPSVPEPPSSGTHLPKPPNLRDQIAASDPHSRPGLRRTRCGPTLGPRLRLQIRGAPLFPYRGLGDVAALGDVLAVLLVSHTDPLLGDHLRGATTCPSHPSDSLPLGPLRRSAPGARAAAGMRRFSGGALAPDTGPERGGWALAGRGPTDWGTSGWPAQRGGRAGGQQAAGIGSPWSRRERGLKEEGKAARGPLGPSARTTSGSAANVSTGRTPPHGSAGSACRRTGRGGLRQP